MRLAFVSHHTSPLAVPGSGDAGGLNVYVRDLAVALADLGVETDIFTRAGDGQGGMTELAPGVKVVALADTGSLDSFTEALHDRCVIGRYDLIHSHYYTSGLAAAVVADRLDLGFVHTSHTLSRLKPPTDFDAGRLLAEHRVAAAADVLIANTQYDAQALVSAYQVSPAKITVVNPGVDHETFRPGDRNEARERLGLAETDLIALYIGRIQRLKGADLAVDAMAELSVRAPDLARRTSLIVVGGPSGGDGGTTYDAIRKTAVDERMLVDVHFEPARAHADVVDLYRAADLCIVPSRSETFGLVALEAQACGIPVVATAVGGLRYVVRSGNGGCLVELPTAELIAFATGQLLANDQARIGNGAAAIANAARFSWADTARSHRAVYRSVAEPVLRNCG